MFTPNTVRAGRKRRPATREAHGELGREHASLGLSGVSPANEIPHVYGCFWSAIALVVTGSLTRTNPMNVVLIVIGCILMALAILMSANRSGYVYFVVGPGSVLVVAGVVGLLAFWILHAAR